MIIRQETSADYKEVYDLVKSSFATTSFSDGTEADYLNGIREKDSFIPELSLVAVEDGKIVGQIVLYQMQITCEDRKVEQLVISPLSVHLDYFGQGIGKSLIAEGCRLAACHGFKAVFLCGDDAYYSRFGFVFSYEHEIFHVKDPSKDSKWCMVKELEKGFLETVSGTVNIE